MCLHLWLMKFTCPECIVDFLYRHSLSGFRPLKLGCFMYNVFKICDEHSLKRWLSSPSNHWNHFSEHMFFLPLTASGAWSSRCTGIHWPRGSPLASKLPRSSLSSGPAWSPTWPWPRSDSSVDSRARFPRAWHSPASLTKERSWQWYVIRYHRFTVLIRNPQLWSNGLFTP